MSDITDDFILTLFKNGKTKEKAFELLVGKYQRTVYYNARRIVNLHEDANDITQNVFIKIWNNLDKFRGESSLKTWITKISVNESLAFFEKKRKMLQLTDSTYTDFILACEAVGNYLPPDEIQQYLHEAILRLPPKQRAVFTMRYYDETPYAEMSEIFDTSESALKTSYHFAAKKVKKFLEERLTF